jgi:hypothetical protein
MAEKRASKKAGSLDVMRAGKMALLTVEYWVSWKAGCWGAR